MINEDEEWRFPPNFPGYSVSSSGRVFDEQEQRSVRVYTSTEYDSIHIWVNGELKHIGVHRLIADAFVAGRTEEKRFVDHIDGDKKNNSIDNLEWVTPAENTWRYRRLAGLTTPLDDAWGPRYYTGPLPEKELDV